MLLILLKFGDTLKVGIHPDFHSLRESAQRSVAAGYKQYSDSKAFQDEHDPCLKRMLLVMGGIIETIIY